MSAPLDHTAPPAGADPWLDRVLAGRYRVLRRLGAGGLGTVYVARHEGLGRDVAVKVLNASVAGNEEHVLRFDREARALAKLKHPNIVTVVDFGTDAGASFLVMEWLEGRPLDAWLADETLPVTVGLELTRQLLRALAYAHAEGVIHRDLKPGNVVVRRLQDGTMHLAVLDFGIARMADDDSPALTRQGGIVGTPAYMAPEQASGKADKPTVDVYAAGLVAYEILVGRRPFVDPDRAALLRAHLVSPPPLPSSVRAELAAIPRLDGFLLKALEKKPVNRFADAGAMLAALDELTASAASRASTPVSPGNPLTAGAASTTADAAGVTPKNPALPQSAAPVAAQATYVSPGTSFTAHVNALASRIHALPRTAQALLAAGVGIAGVVALAVFVVVVVPRSLPADGSVAPTVGSPARPSAAAPLPPSAHPYDRGVPPELTSLHRSITTGGRPSRDALQLLYRYNARNRTDARGQLLLGWTATERRWFSEAIDAYEEACEREPASKSDRRLREDLLRMVAIPSFATGAERVLLSCVGTELIPEAERAVATADSRSRPRLEAFVARLRALPPPR